MCTACLCNVVVFCPRGSTAHSTLLHTLYSMTPKLIAVHQNLHIVLQGPNVAVSLQSEELGIAAARLLAAQGMVKQGQMPDAGPVSGWPSPSASDEPSSSSMAPSGTSKRVSTEHSRLCEQLFEQLRDVFDSLLQHACGRRSTHASSIFLLKRWYSVLRLCMDFSLLCGFILHQGHVKRESYTHCTTLASSLCWTGLMACFCWFSFPYL